MYFTERTFGIDSTRAERSAPRIRFFSRSRLTLARRTHCTAPVWFPRQVVAIELFARNHDCMRRIEREIADKPSSHDHPETPAEEMAESHEEETEPWEDAPTWPGIGQEAPQTAPEAGAFHDAVVS